MGRAPCCEKVGLKRGRWTAEEDEILARYIAQHGEGSWRSLPKNAGLLRCGKSCRLRWINYLRADLKRGNISKDEQETIIKLHATLGNRWSLIANHLPGRTDNEIKNYWNSHLSRQIHSFRRTCPAGEDATVTVDLSRLHSGSKRRGGRTSRLARSRKQAEIDAAKIKDHSPATVATASSSTSSRAQSDELHSIMLDPDMNPGRNSNSGSNSNGNTSEGPCSEAASGATGSGPIDIGFWEAESDMEALFFSSTGPDPGPMGPRAVEQGQVEELFDMGWEGLEAHLWNGLWESDQHGSFHPAESKGIGCDSEGQTQLESFASWLLSDSL